MTLATNKPSKKAGLAELVEAPLLFWCDGREGEPFDKLREAGIWK
jgi:hypothetical protein